MDIFRRTFEHMDAKEYIIEDLIAAQWLAGDEDDGDQVRIAELEFSVNKAVQILSTAV